ncbi:MAG: tetratricopeptide repeat protein, partial [Acidobacteriaceae bacterium]|nr:tetratricopeptide repeat protein [Acidobacteriaceae bacterium]
PKSPDLLTRLAETYRRKGDANTAIDTFRRCTEVAPNNTGCLLQTALGLESTGRSDQSQAIYEQILKINPDHPIALNNLAYMKAEQDVDVETALTMAQRAHQKVPNSPAIADTLGWIYIRKNLSEEAVRIYKDLVEKNPGEAAFHYHYGMALIQKGDKPTAKREFMAALKSTPPPSKTDRAKIQELLQSP